MTLSESSDAASASERISERALEGASEGASVRAVELAARTSYGRLVALLSSRSRDVSAAEDALGDAFAAALIQWPNDGVPDNPEGWLLNSARRRLIDRERRDAVRQRAEPALVYELAEHNMYAALHDPSLDGELLLDRRLELLFACAHPAIDPTIRTPLMLQTVLGLEASVIASAFLSAPSTMAQRLVRAKRKIRDAGIPFELPDPSVFSSRLESVLEAVYAAFGAAWDAVVGGDNIHADLGDEAIYLGRLIVRALPQEAEARGLLALMLYCEARRRARRGRSGEYVALAAQRPADWDVSLIGEAESLLQSAAALGAPGRFQIEAAIQSAHLAPAFGRPADNEAIVTLYDALLTYAPTVAVLVNRAAALSRARTPSDGLTALDAIDAGAVDEYQPYWALRAHLLTHSGQTALASQARARAVGLTQDPAVRAFLMGSDRA